MDVIKYGNILFEGNLKILEKEAKGLCKILSGLPFAISKAFDFIKKNRVNMAKFCSLWEKSGKEK